MTAEFDKIKQDIADFNARIQSWNYDELTDDEAEEIADRLEETIGLLADEEGPEGDDSDEDEEYE